MYLPESDALVLYIPHERPTMADLEDFMRDVHCLISLSKFKKVAINLKKLKQVDFGGIKYLLNLKKSLEQLGYSVVFYNLSPKLVRYLPSSRLSKSIKLAAS